ncbi:hypothetical protein RB614_12540 [Phytohabitans sp. ZYX-F-186]|uniref:Uncharacterized protein n=1 Tax=Phytohabitans maris TaxID=3071409 RepID=A0ABU0ZE96_9ACTN|nr:hypothetical protein [Phytohabitans sp. ZYX-F-186]MDQ7905353.1 hypothetical protein [Phytohabitans sp. ZYX-F-186]
MGRDQEERWRRAARRRIRETLALRRAVAAVAVRRAVPAVAEEDQRRAA